MILCAGLGLLWLRSHFRADRVRWFRDNGTCLQFVSARGRLYIRHEDLGYRFPDVQIQSEVIRPAHTAGRDYRLNAATLGRDVDWRFAGFELARGNDQRLDFWGYRLTYGPDAQMLNPFWSVQIPIWSLFLIGAALPMGRAIHFVRQRHRLARGLCGNCGYDIRASTARCPECGQAIPQPSVDSVGARIA